MKDRKNSTFRWLFWGYVGAFIANETLSVWFGGRWFESWLCLNNQGSAWTQPWRLITYSFLHRNGWHLLFNLLLLYGFVRFLLYDTVSPQRWLLLYGLGIIVGGIFWTLVHHKQDSSVLVGASAGICSLFTYYCLQNPEKSFSGLLYFFFPVHIQAKWCFWALTAYTGWNTLFYEVQGFTHVAHSAHFGGILVGWLAIEYPKHRLFPSFKRKKSSRKATYQVHRHSYQNTPFALSSLFQCKSL